jgi:hypothetical protein
VFGVALRARRRYRRYTELPFLCEDRLLLP